MANRIVGNTIIVDSGMGNSFILTSANQAINITNFRVNAIGFRAINTTSTISISAGLDTTNVIYFQGYLQGGSGGQISVLADKLFDITHFGTPQQFDTLKVPILTAGTAYIYLA